MGNLLLLEMTLRGTQNPAIVSGFSLKLPGSWGQDLLGPGAGQVLLGPGAGQPGGLPCHYCTQPGKGVGSHENGWIQGHLEKLAFLAL